MGNFQELLAKSKPIEEYSQIKNIDDPRSDSEVQLSNRLVSALTALNTENILKHKQIMSHHLDWSQYIFVCIHGIPSISTEFDFLKLPGEQIHFSGLSFEERQPHLSEEEQLKRAKLSTFEQEAERLNQLIESIEKNKKIVLVYHSFGNFYLSFYFYLFKDRIKDRVKGMIDIAGAPSIFYTSARMFSPIILETDFSVFEKEVDRIHKIFIKTMSSTGFRLDFKNKYQTLSFMRYIQSKNYGVGFQITLDHPNILKLIIHGTKDSLFESPLLNEKAIHFCYKRDLPENYEKQMLQKYNSSYHPKIKVKNIQERFILSIPGGQHSVHHQEQNKELIMHATQQYLVMIHE